MAIQEKGRQKKEDGGDCIHYILLLFIYGTFYSKIEIYCFYVCGIVVMDVFFTETKRFQLQRVKKNMCIHTFTGQSC